MDYFNNLDTSNSNNNKNIFQRGVENLQPETLSVSILSLCGVPPSATHYNHTRTRHWSMTELTFHNTSWWFFPCLLSAIGYLILWCLFLR